MAKCSCREIPRRIDLIPGINSATLMPANRRRRYDLGHITSIRRLNKFPFYWWQTEPKNLCPYYILPSQLFSSLRAPLPLPPPSPGRPLLRGMYPSPSWPFPSCPSSRPTNFGPWLISPSEREKVRPSVSVSNFTREHPWCSPCQSRLFESKLRTSSLQLTCLF